MEGKPRDEGGPLVLGGMFPQNGGGPSLPHILTGLERHAVAAQPLVRPLPPTSRTAQLILGLSESGLSPRRCNASRVIGRRSTLYRQVRR